MAFCLWYDQCPQCLDKAGIRSVRDCQNIQFLIGEYAPHFELMTLKKRMLCI